MFESERRASRRMISDARSSTTPDVLARFHPLAQRYRRRLRWFLRLTAAGFGLSLLSIILPAALLLWFGFPAIACVLGGLTLFFTLPALVCPSCRKSAEAFGEFCPVYG